VGFEWSLALALALALALTLALTLAPALAPALTLTLALALTLTLALTRALALSCGGGRLGMGSAAIGASLAVGRLEDLGASGSQSRARPSRAVPRLPAPALTD
jgi:predicted RNA methylase